MAVVTVILAAHVDGQGFNQPESYWEMVNPPKKNLDLSAAKLFASSEVAVSEVEKFLRSDSFGYDSPPQRGWFQRPNAVWNSVVPKLGLTWFWVQISQIHQIPSTVGT